MPSKNGKNGKKPRPRAYRTTPLHREPGFAKLRGLKCFDEVHRRIVEGWHLSAIAAYIQDEEKEYTETTRAGVVTELQRYRDSIPPAQLIKSRMPQVFDKAADEVQKGLDELEELEKLYRRQVKRIDIDMASEQKIGKLFPTMTQEIRTAREILHSIAQLKMDLGLNDRHIGTVDVDAHITAHCEQHANSRVATVLADPQQRQRLLGIAKGLMRVANRDVIEVTAEEVKTLPPPASSSFDEAEPRVAAGGTK